MNLNERPLRNINSCIKNVSESIRKLHENCCSELESDILIAELKTEKLKALAATARTQALLAEMEMVRTAQQLNDKIRRAELHCFSQHGSNCKCISKLILQKTPSKNSHRNQVKKLLSNKNNGKVKKPYKNKAKLFTNSKCNLLRSVEKTIEANKVNLDTKDKKDKINEQSKLNVTKNLFAPDNGASVAHTGAINKSIITATSLATYKPIRGHPNRKAVTEKGSNNVIDVSKNYSVSAESFNANVSKFFGSQASKPKLNVAKRVDPNQSNAEKPNNVNGDILKARTSNIVNNKPVITTTMSNTVNAVNKNLGSVKRSILIDTDKTTTAKENRYNRYGQKPNNNRKKYKKETRNTDTQTKHEKPSLNIAAQNIRIVTENTKNDDTKMDVEYPNSRTSNKNKIGHHHHHQKTSTKKTVEPTIPANGNMKGKIVNMYMDFRKCSTNMKKYKNKSLEHTITKDNFNIRRKNTVTEMVALGENVFLKALDRHAHNNETKEDSFPKEEPKELNETATDQLAEKKETGLYNIFAKDLTFDKIEIIDEPMDVDTDASFEETVENIHKEILKTNSV